MGDARADDAIRMIDIRKTFGRGGAGVRALDGLSLSIPRGMVYGLLGPNGAGKSTLLRIIAGLIRPDSGHVELFGAPAGPLSRQSFGMLIEAPAFYPFLTAREHLDMLARLSAAPLSVDAVLRRVGLFDAANKKVSGYSLGMKQRLGIGCTLIGQPQALVLDEPTNGLDPEGILEMRSLIRDLAVRDGMTVLLSSHMLDEVERICHRVAILRHGQLAAEGAVADLLDRKGRFWLKVDHPDQLLSRLGEGAEPGEGGIFITMEQSNVPDLIHSLVTGGVRIHEAKWVKPDLESVFLSQTREMEE
ncbi:ABC transporter ATP-binding protein [Rhizobium sp. FY34]|uniref:ABC transporter ATP-binding protein n=1 Tax=Rhizobium sp. FY34 TaxID=2562309 RepID=UPI0010BF6AEE|nr:ABC transporter ATP-binding protein [Rhizobium sp. FY34]